ncbi:MAG: L-2-amino-thiazoline-4-carboxylic acid hydrolase [Candidatus Kariarchaeaceae archaeon]|jgi:hypothetical protein
MTLEYEYYGTYDDNAGDKINLESQFRGWLREMELMFDYVKNTKPEILESFLKKVESKYLTELEGRSFELADVGLDRLAKDQTLLGAYSHFKELVLQVIMRYIPFREGYILSEEEEPIRWLDFLCPNYMLLYHRISALVEILGRDSGIDFYKKFVKFWGKELAKKGLGTHTIESVREERVKTWKEGNAMEFAVVDVDQAMFLAKFDKCISYESMKHTEDQELAYYTVCYPAPILLKYAHQNISMRRNQTLFTADFCDELRWDRHVHDEPEQPSLELSRKLVPK